MRSANGEWGGTRGVGGFLGGKAALILLATIDVQAPLLAAYHSHAFETAELTKASCLASIVAFVYTY